VSIKSPVNLKTKMDRRELFGKPDLSVICTQEIECRVYERQTKYGSKRPAGIVLVFANNTREVCFLGAMRDALLSKPLSGEIDEIKVKGG